MAEGARLESVYALIAYRGFESLSLRQIKKAPPKAGPFLFGGARVRIRTPCAAPRVRKIRQERIFTSAASPKGEAQGRAE